MTHGETPSVNSEMRGRVAVETSLMRSFSTIVGCFGTMSEKGMLLGHRVELPLISIVTVCLNSADVIEKCLESVASQTYARIQHIVIDGASNDATCEIVRRFPHVASLVSEPDRGLYDAMNKGIAAATGDIVGILNADDFFPHPRVIEKVAEQFQSPSVDATIADVAFVSPKDPRRIVRYYSAKGWHAGKFRDGFMPPHPSFFVRRCHYQRLGGYRTDYEISADFELLVRFLHASKLQVRYLNEPVVFMRTGGTSNATWRRRWVLNQETLRACREHGIETGAARLAFRYVRKIWEFVPWIRG